MMSLLGSARLDRIRMLLADAGADALLVVGTTSSDPDLATFVGKVHLGECAVVLADRSQPCLAYATDMERGEAARTGLDLLPPARLIGKNGGQRSLEPADRAYRLWRAALHEAGLERGRLALAGRYPAGTTAAVVGRLGAEGFETIDFTRQMALARKAKTESEVEEISRVASATCGAMRAVAAALAASEAVEGVLHLDQAPLTAGRLRRLVRSVFVDAELTEPEGNIISAGADAAIPHTQGSDQRELRPGESIVVDLYPKGALFADCSRTFCVGTPPEKVAAAHELVRAALVMSSAMARPGAAAATLQANVCDLFEEHGWPTPRSAPGGVRGYVHGLGHGVGLELHEQPLFRSSGPQGRLDVDDVFTLEPGLYDPEAGFGIRIEDLFWLAEGGLNTLTPLPFDLDPTAW